MSAPTRLRVYLTDRAGVDGTADVDVRSTRRLSCGCLRHEGERPGVGDGPAAVHIYESRHCGVGHTETAEPTP